MNTRSTNSEFYQKLSSLHAWDNERWLPLPAWSLFYLELGTILASASTPENSRIITALAVPARSYVSALVAAGFVLVRALNPDIANQNDKHIAQLKQLPIGTTVSLHQEKRRYTGTFQGVMYGFGKVFFSIQVDHGNNTKRMVPEAQASTIEILEQQSISLPKKQKGRLRKDLSPLALELLDSSGARFSSETSLECIILGKLTVIERELKEQRLSLQTNDSHSRAYQEGVLQDILRTRRFLPVGATYRSHVLPSSNRRTGELIASLSPKLVIFDGSVCYLKWHQTWQQAHSIIVLDRTEPNFEAACAQLNQEYIQYRLDCKLAFGIPPSPAGVEMMIFEVSK